MMEKERMEGGGGKVPLDELMGSEILLISCYKWREIISWKCSLTDLICHFPSADLAFFFFTFFFRGGKIVYIKTR